MFWAKLHRATRHVHTSPPPEPLSEETLVNSTVDMVLDGLRLAARRRIHAQESRIWHCSRLKGGTTGLVNIKAGPAMLFNRRDVKR